MTTFSMKETFEGPTFEVESEGVGVGSSFDLDSTLSKHGYRCLRITNSTAEPTDWPGSIDSGAGLSGALDVVWSVYLRFEGDIGLSSIRQFMRQDIDDTFPFIEFGLEYTDALNLTPYVDRNLVPADSHRVNGTPFAFDLDRWYLLDMRTSFSGLNVTLDWMIDGFPQTSLTSITSVTVGADTVTYTPNILHNWPTTGATYVDDWWITTDSSAYPIGEHPTSVFRSTVLIDQLRTGPSIEEVRAREQA